MRRGHTGLGWTTLNPVDSGLIKRCILKTFSKENETREAKKDWNIEATVQGIPSSEQSLMLGS